MVCGDEVANGKPDPEGFLRGAALLGVAPEDCVACEDAPAGIRAARAAGMCVIAIATTHAPSALADASAVIADLRALDDALASLRGSD
jgi:sugar-phosphatase